MSYCEGSTKTFIYLSVEATEECHKVFPLPKQIKLNMNEVLTLFWIRVCTHVCQTTDSLQGVNIPGPDF